MADAETQAGTMPGYRRSVRITSECNAVRAELEDDFHCMEVRVAHDGARVLAVEAHMHRAPWTTCPGAMAQLRETLLGQALRDITPRLEKPRNCTHLHDLAVVAAAHAGEPGVTHYAMAISDPVDGRRFHSITRGGELVHQWEEVDGTFVAPAGLAGLTSRGMRDWIAALPEGERMAARLLQVAAVISSGRTFPWERAEAPADMPPVCFTWQPERAKIARRLDPVFEFSRSGRLPLE